MPTLQPISTEIAIILTGHEVAEILKVRTHSVYWLHRTKQLRGFNVARKLRFRRADVLAYIDKKVKECA